MRPKRQAKEKQEAETPAGKAGLRQQAEESLKLFRALIDRSNDTIEVVDPATGRFLDVNERGCIDLGYSRAEYLSLRVFDVDPRTDPVTFAQDMARLRESGSMTWEGIHRRKDGTTFPVEVNLQYVRLDRDYLVAVVRDITERKAHEQKILEYQRQLQALASQLTLVEEHLRQDVAAQIHDEISQPLAIAKLQVETLAAAESAPRRHEPLGEVAGLLERMLQATRALTVKLSYPALNVLGLAQAVERWLRDEVEVKHGLEATFEDDGADKPLDDDVRAVLFRGVRELLTNVVKHARATRVAVSVTRAGDQITLVVSDNGVGFDPEKALARSRGFGLLSLRESLERLGGSLCIESHPQAGSKVILRGPLQTMHE